MVLLAAFNVLLHKYTGQEDIVVGSGIAGRPHVDLQDIVGMFVNTLALRNRPRGGQGFMEFLEEVRSNCVMAFENQDLQFEELVERLNIERDASRNPLFAVELNVQNFERPQVAARSLGDLKFSAFAFDHHTCKFDMILYAVEQGEGISFNLEYAAALFKRTTIEKIARRYLEILEQVNRDRHIRLMDIQLSHDVEFLSSHTFDNDPEDFQF
jgi:non-ribosomal peptide synthetase component F